MKNLLPIVFLAVIVLLLAALNYTPGMTLTGGDNLHPEFNFPVNIQRSLFAVWQEYQGLGLLGGMGHASDLLRQVFLYFLSFIFPVHFLRFLFTMLAIFIGSSGTYVLIKMLVHAKKIAFVGALFYICNLGTMQAFYTPFEVFTMHFAALPWLLYGLVRYATNRTRKNLALFILLSILSTPQGYVPTLFLVYFFSVALLLPTLFPPTSLGKTKILLRESVKIGIATLLINAFWLLPFLYFTATNASVNVNAKINQMATETIFLQNKEFGNMQDVMLLKGFWLNNADPNKDGIFAYMLVSWRDHLANPFIAAIGYALFVIVLFGVFQAVKTKKPLLLGFAILFFFSVTMLATNTPPFSWLDILFRKIPLFDQAFRFPFTKFSILTALTYAVFFSVGIQSITKLVVYRIKNQESRIKRIIHYSLFIIPVFLLIVFALPAFQGHLFYDKERLAIPKEYFDMFAFFQKQDQNTRIANFPQTSFWGWSFERWGYGGSGFLWYGIKQPILDRAFDVWSKEDETYYFELSHALYGKDKTLFLNVLNKYQITWLLVDKNIINPSAPKALFFRPLQDLIKEIPTITKSKTFGNIDVYKVTLADNPKNFVFLTRNLPTINSYAVSENDQGYTDHKNYIVGIGNSSHNTDWLYPFRTLFSNKLQKDIAFSTKEAYDDITFFAIIPPSEKQTTLTVPSLLQKETLLPVDLVIHKNNNQTLLAIKIQTPAIFLDYQNISGTTTEQTLFTISPNVQFPLTLNVNGIATYTIRDENEYIQRTFIATKTDNIFVLQNADGTKIQSQTVPTTFLTRVPSLFETALPIIPHPKPITLTVKVPKIHDGFIGTTIEPTDFDKAKNCDNFRDGESFSIIENNSLLLSAKNATACISLFLSSLPHQQGYALFIPQNHIEGRALHFWILNDQEDFSPIDTYLTTDTNLNTFILAPQEDFDKGYSFHFDSMSIGNLQTTNTIGEISLYPIPYQYLTSLTITTTDGPKKETPVSLEPHVTHPNESLYTVIFDKNPPKNITLVLSQGFNNGWKAFRIQNSEFSPRSEAGKIQNWINTAFPFLFGTEVKGHVLINNWENGWLIDDHVLPATSYTLVILFLPQYLEYFGFILLFGTFGWFLFLWLKTRLEI